MQGWKRKRLRIWHAEEGSVMLKQLILAVLGAVTMMTSLPDSIPAQSGFYHTVGRNIISPDGKKTTLYGMGFGNDVWCSSLSEVGLHHNEDSFREMKDLGFNSVRFLLNYRWFEDDDKPYTYKQEGFDYIDQSIAWAKKYGIGLVLNMHYPQGGYQSQGKGTALWTDPENQKRLVSLWGEIA
ncbi:MAG TPA: retaining beta-glycosidase, partial [Ruminococcaceae bacterium]|nr:retaining beta-glycosidase [Oscillospiraceae bacterium]